MARLRPRQPAAPHDPVRGRVLATLSPPRASPRFRAHPPLRFPRPSPSRSTSTPLFPAPEIGDRFAPGSTIQPRGRGASLHHPAFSLDLSSMRRPHDRLGATQRRPNRPAFSTPSPAEELMKRSRPVPKRSGPSAPTLFVCLSEPAALFHSPSIAFDRGPSTLPSPLPPRFATPPARLPRAPPSNPAPETRFKSHSVGTRLPSNGCIESAPSRPS